MHGEKFVVGFGLHQIALRREQLQAQQGGGHTADNKEKRHRQQVEPGDPLVIGGEEPGFNAVAHVQIMQAAFQGIVAHFLFCSPFSGRSSDLRYEMICEIPSSVISPLNVGMIG